MLLQNGSVFIHGTHFEDVTVEISKDKIVALHPPSEIFQHAEALDENPMVYDATGCYIVPGFLDIHFHGCIGIDFCDNQPKGLEKIAAYQLENGITGICPATMTMPEPVLSDIIFRAKQYREKPHPFSAVGADLLGIHLEGPFISPAKVGAQNPNYILSPDIEMFRRLQKIAPDLLKVITIAPETKGAFEFIEAIHKDIVISLGHTNADYETAKTAFDKGARQVTHLFNAMPPFSHRKPGVIGAAFDTKDTCAELICDGIHLSDTAIRFAFQLFTDNRIILISDSMMAAGMEPGCYSLGGQTVNVAGNVATLKDGTIAGSVSNLMQCFQHAVNIGIPLESALKAVTINPARAIGEANTLGSIEQGKVANLLILNKDLSIRHIIFHGHQL